MRLGACKRLHLKTHVTLARLGGMSTAANTLRGHLAQVADLRLIGIDPILAEAFAAVRHIQVLRFKHTYGDFLLSSKHSAATSFFLEELYGNHDFAARDQQFARIAGAIERLFPERVMAIAVQMAQVHALTELLDWEMARHWVALAEQDSIKTPLQQAKQYVKCWQATGRAADRNLQLQGVLDMGLRLDGVVHTVGLRTALRLMRTPAQAAGLGQLQTVLEDGFDAFKAMGNAGPFLSAVKSRELAWMDSMFALPGTAATSALASMLQKPE